MRKVREGINMINYAYPNEIIDKYFEELKLANQEVKQASNWIPSGSIRDDGAVLNDLIEKFQEYSRNMHDYAEAIMEFDAEIAERMEENSKHFNHIYNQLNNLYRQLGL
jgi:hypothetical protein